MPPQPDPRPLRALLVEDTGEAPRLAPALAAIPRLEPICSLESVDGLVARVAQHDPHLILVHTRSPTRALLDALAALAAASPRPVVIFTTDASGERIRAALDAGVSAYVVDGIEPARLESIVRVAIERFEAEQRLRSELAQARERLAERKLVERAKGLLMQQRKCSEEEAFTALRGLAMQRGIRLADAARQVIDVSSLLG